MSRYSIYKNEIIKNDVQGKITFDKDGRDWYVYRVTDLSRIDEKHYYGYHVPKKGKKYKSLIEEFWTYKTSSKFNDLDESNKENYKIKIVKVF
jgi:hypothetical protein